MRNRRREVGIRVPDHPVCRLLVELLGEPLLTGSVTPAEAQFEAEDAESLSRRFGQDVRVVIDGGVLWPNPSTVLSLVEDEIVVLREGQGEVPR
jgi:tRNA A37 threonylcarbamoyladenosine synthetase subunit TsaC/SUA5/YrdC